MLIEGRVVKGINFVDLVDAGDPVEQAKIYSKNGADEITFLDITATHEKKESNGRYNRKNCLPMLCPFNRWWGGQEDLRYG